jgi:hypothetical protein
MIFEINVDDSELVPAVAKELSENWQSDICETVAEKFDASDIAEHISVWDIAHEIDMEEFYANFEIEYEDLANNIIDANNFKEMIAGLMWQQFSEEFGASMKCVREELAVIHRELDARAVPIWKRWFSNANKEETGIA